MRCVPDVSLRTTTSGCRRALGVWKMIQAQDRHRLLPETNSSSSRCVTFDQFTDREQGFRDETPLWPPKGGDFFPWRIKISRPQYTGETPEQTSSLQISALCSGRSLGQEPFKAQTASSTIGSQRRTSHSLRVTAQRSRVDNSGCHGAEAARVQNLFRLIGSDVLESLKRILPERSVWIRFNGKRFPSGVRSRLWWECNSVPRHAKG